MSIGKTVWSVKCAVMGILLVMGMTSVAEPTVTVDEVTTGEPWSKVTVNYTLGGTDVKLEYKVAFAVTAGGQTASVTNDAAKLTDGAAAQVIDTVALFGKQVADTKAKVRVSLIAVKPKLPGVQLWAGGPYFAECNLGAEKPTDYGWYFWWGDTVGYKRNEADTGWVSVVDGKAFWFGSGSETAMSTYEKDSATLKAKGWIDDSGNLVAAHDAATAKLGAPWRMMTDAELQKLVDSSVCKCEWTENYNGSGINGCLITGVTEGYTDKSIFLPAASYGDSSLIGRVGSDCWYWSSTPISDDPRLSRFFNSLSGGSRSSIHRCRGMSVRPVR